MGVCIGDFRNFGISDSMKCDLTGTDGAASVAVGYGYAVRFDVDHAGIVEDLYAVVGNLHPLAGQGLMPDDQAVGLAPFQKVRRGLGSFRRGLVSFRHVFVRFLQMLDELLVIAL